MVVATVFEKQLLLATMTTTEERFRRREARNLSGVLSFVMRPPLTLHLFPPDAAPFVLIATPPTQNGQSFLTLSGQSCLYSAYVSTLFGVLWSLAEVTCSYNSSERTKDVLFNVPGGWK